MGNIGQADAVCVHQYIGLNKETTYRCVKGKIYKLSYAGFLADKGHDEKEETSFNWDNDFCGDPTLHPQLESCNK